MTLRFIQFLSASLILVLLSFAPAIAQTPTPSLTSTVAPRPSFSLGSGQETTFTWTVQSAGAQATSLQVTPSLVVPTGWTATADLAPFTLGGPNGAASKTIPVRITLPPEAENVANGDLRLLATGTTAAGQTASAPQQTVKLTYVAPIVPPAPIPPDYTWAIVSGILGALVLTALGAYWFQARRVGLVIDAPVKRFNVGTGGSYKVVVTNPKKVPQNVQLRVQGLPKQWSAAFSFPVVPLNAGERSQVPLWVNVPGDAVPNMHQGFRIQARPNRFSPWIVTRKLQVDTLDVNVTQKPADVGAKQKPA